MANPVVQTTSTGVAVAAEVVGTSNFQQIKLVAGSTSMTVPIDATSGVPHASSMGLVVALKDGAQVTIASMPTTFTVNTAPTVAGASVVAQVSGTVTIAPTILTVNTAATVAGASVTAQVSGTVTISPTTFTVNTGATVAGASVTAQVSGTISVSNLPGSTTGSSGMSGVLVWLGASQTVLISTQVSGTVSLSGTQIASVVPGVSVNLGSFATVVATTTGASGVTGPIVWLGASQSILVTVVAGAGGGGSVTTAAPSISASGQVMWVAGGQSTTAFPIYVSQINAPAAGGGSVTTAAPSVSATGQVVWLAGGQSTSASPIYVSQINPPAGGGGSVTTAAPSISATAQIMWIVGGQSTTAFPVVVTGTVTAGSVTTVVSIGSIVNVTTQASVSVSGLPVWWNPTAAVVVNTATSVVSGTVAISIPVSQALGTVITILGTQVVTVVPGLSVVAQASGTLTVNVSGVVPVVTQASVSVTGVPVWWNPTASVVVANLTTVVSGTVAISIPVSQALGTVITILGTQVVSVVPGLSVSAVVSGTVTPIGTLAVTGSIQTILGTAVVSVVPGVSVNLGGLATAVMTTAQASGVTGQLVWFAASQTLIQSVSVSVSVSVLNSGTIAVSGAIDAVTTQTAVTGAPVWLAATQTMAVVSTVGTVLNVLGSVNVFHGVGTAVAFSYTTAVAPTVLFQPAFIIAQNLTTVAATTAYVVPAGKVLRVEAIMARVQNTLASVAIANAQVFFLASTAAFTTAAPIFALLGFGNATSATGAVGFGQAMPSVVFPAGATVGLNMHVSGGSSQPFAFVVQGALYP